MQNTPRLGIQLLGTFESRESTDEFIKDHKVFLNGEYEKAKKLLSVPYQQFVEVVSSLEESNPPQEEEQWKEHASKLLAEKFPEYAYDKFVEDIRIGRRISRLDAMCNVSSYTVYETAIGEAKHLLPQNL